MKVKIVALDNQFIHQALNVVSGQRLPVMTAFKINGLKKNIEKQVDEGRKFYIDNILKKHAELNEAGEFIMQKNDKGEDIPGTFKLKEPVKETEALLNKDVQEYMDMEIELPVQRITMDELAKINIEPMLLEALAPFIVGADVEVGPVDYSKEADKAAKVLEMKQPAQDAPVSPA